MSNPGLGQLKTMIRTVGAGRMTSSASMARIVSDISPDDGSSNDDPFDDGRSVVNSISSHFASRGPTLTSSATTSSLSTLKSIKPSRQPILESSKESLLAEEIKGKSIRS